ncbi:MULTISPECIES: hypothetical protein [Paenibacillus]|uniref:hypothetical protein n=1 Tax=Paenibacillus TaxID=44249 RepID=UPI0010A7A716|nr:MULTISPECIES: hypothetical protein [Paenibacillus]
MQENKQSAAWISREFWLHLFCKSSINIRLLQMTGFHIIHAYGGWKKEPLTSASPEMIFICRKAG